MITIKQLCIHQDEVLHYQLNNIHMLVRESVSQQKQPVEKCHMLLCLTDLMRVVLFQTLHDDRPVPAAPPFGQIENSLHCVLVGLLAPHGIS